jgi:Na+-transporting methylmalonyl-CoA/oxaloacetate decarboxylase gamma subunit
LPLEAPMTEVFIVLSLFVALAWAIVRAVLMFVHIDAVDETPSQHADPISTYVDENYGSHFVDDPISINHSMRRR